MKAAIIAACALAVGIALAAVIGSFAFYRAVKKEMPTPTPAAQTQTTVNPTPLLQEPTNADRIGFGNQIEKKFLREGKSVDVTFPNDGNSPETYTILKFKYALVSKAFVFQMQESGFLDQAKKLGFKTVIFTDGLKSEWRFDL